MQMYERAPVSRRQRRGYTGLFAIICLFASIFVAWAVMKTSIVKTGLEMTTGMNSNASVKPAAKP
jgi:hypothetical protein